jgi:YcxB-like protein
MEIRYTASRRDVGALLKHNLRHSARLWAILLGLAMFPAAFNALIALASRREITRDGVVTGLILGALAAVALPLIGRLRTKRDERVLTIGPEGIRTSIGKLSGEVPWSKVAAVDVTAEYVFITGKNANGFAIPARAFATPAERTEFLRQIDAFRTETR